MLNILNLDRAVRRYTGDLISATSASATSGSQIKPLLSSVTNTGQGNVSA